MKRRTFLAAALSALAGSTALRGAVLPLTLPDDPIDLAKQAGFTAPTAPAEPANVFFWGTKGGIHPALFDSTHVSGLDAIYEKFARAMAERIDEEFWRGFAPKRAVPTNKRLTSFPVRKFRNHH